MKKNLQGFWTVGSLFWWCWASLQVCWTSSLYWRRACPSWVLSRKIKNKINVKKACIKKHNRKNKNWVNLGEERSELAFKLQDFVNAFFDSARERKKPKCVASGRRVEHYNREVHFCNQPFVMEQIIWIKNHKRKWLKKLILILHHFREAHRLVYARKGADHVLK
jgi:hypothetical protein